MVTWPRTLGAVLAEELASSPRRLWVSLRLTIIATLGIGLIASCHVTSELGSYIVWLVVGAGPMMAVGKAVPILVIEGLMLASSVVMGRALAETPWLMLPFVFAFMVCSTFINISRKLGPSVLLIQVVSLGSLYGVVFAPAEVGWTAAANFGGSLIAYGIIVLFDNWLWPDRAEPILIESLRESAARHSQRLTAAVRFFLDAHAVAQPREPPPTSELTHFLTLLDQSVVEGLSAHQHALLLAAVTRMTRIQLQTGRLTIVARDPVPGQVRLLLRREIEDAAATIAAALDEIAHDAATLMRSGADRSPSAPARRARSSMDALASRIEQVRPTYIRWAGGAELANFASFTDCLEGLTRLLERPLDEPPPFAAPKRQIKATTGAPGKNEPLPVTYCLKVGLCSVIGYVIGLAAQRPELSVILTTVVITGLPTFGASLHKMILRIVGAVLGGLISLLAIIVVTPNFQTLPAYLLAIFLVLYVSAYSSLSSGRTAYAGKQIGTTFLLVFAGLSPSADVYGPLWRIWGILLGTVVVTVVLCLLWPEYASDSLLPRLRRAMRNTIALVPHRPQQLSEATIEQRNSEVMSVLAEMLAIADDARLEGSACQIDHEAVVEAAGTLRRIANRLTGISIGRIEVPLPRLDEDTEFARESVINAILMRLKWWLARFEASTNFRMRDGTFRVEASYDGIALHLKDFAGRLEAQQFARLASWTLDQSRTILSEMGSLRRLEFLMTELDRYLTGVTLQSPLEAGQLRVSHSRLQDY